MRRLYVLSITAAGLLAFTTTSSAAENKPIDVSASARVVSMPSPAGFINPAASYRGLDETNITVGLETSGVPCGNCVGGAGTPNIGLAWPVFTVSQGQTLTISTWFESATYTGPCEAGLILKQGTTVIGTGTVPIEGGCQAGYLYGAWFTVPVPTTTGFTTVIGTVKGGGNKSGADTFINVQ
ncbi:MAG: hypothetical protein ACLP59_15280 [Bryobacteraceae bacterium]